MPRSKSLVRDLIDLEHDVVGKILAGVLGNMRDSQPFIQHTSGYFQLCVRVQFGKRTQIDQICYHKDWAPFVELVREYSDYTPGDV